jgi:hypothetical protein
MVIIPEDVFRFQRGKKNRHDYGAQRDPNDPRLPANSTLVFHLS